MLTAVLDDSYERALAICQSGLADAYELRLDRLGRYDEKKVRTIRESTNAPLILTVGERLDLIEGALRVEPDYIDVRWDVPLPENLGRTQRIASFHDYTGMPSSPTALLAEMRQMPAAIYKIAALGRGLLDALEMATLSYISDVPCVAIAMGEASQLSRLLLPAVSAPLWYVATSHNRAPGALSIEEWPHITPSTRLYALLGHPVTQSPSHITHNALFTQEGIDAHYLKIDIDPNELERALPLLQALPFSGFSVTMPYKGRFDLPSTNTLTRTETGEWATASTDGAGALDAIESVTSVTGKEVAILGRGGAARAIQAEATHRGARVELYGRRGLRPFSELDSPDILINTTPVTPPIEPQQIKEGSVVLDARLDLIRTPLLELAEERGAIALPGLIYFAHQAAGQFALWYGKALPKNRIIEAVLRAAQSPHLALHR